jgi:hypothetical protein
MRKVQACIGFSVENLEWLRGRNEGISAFLDSMVTALREQSPMSVKPAEPGSVADRIKSENAREMELRETQSREYVELAGVAIARQDEDKKECLEMIRQKILENPSRWLLGVYNNKTPFNKAMRLEILNAVKLECDQKPTDDDISEVFREEYQKYKKERDDQKTTKRQV